MLARSGSVVVLGFSLLSLFLSTTKKTYMNPNITYSYQLPVATCHLPLATPHLPYLPQSSSMQMQSTLHNSIQVIPFVNNLLLRKYQRVKYPFNNKTSTSQITLVKLTVFIFPTYIWNFVIFSSLWKVFRVYSLL